MPDNDWDNESPIFVISESPKHHGNNVGDKKHVLVHHVQASVVSRMTASEMVSCVFSVDTQATIPSGCIKK